MYACRLPVDGDGASAFDDLKEMVASWVGGEASVDSLDTEAGSSRPSADEGVRWRRLDSPDGGDRLWTLWWDRPYRGQPDLIWTLTARVTLDRGRSAVLFHVGVSTSGKRLLPVRFDVEPLPLAQMVVDRFEVFEDGWQVTGEPAYACDRDGARVLAELLLDPARVLPVVVVSPVSSIKGPLVDAHAISETLVGLAHVAVLDAPQITFDLTHFVGPHLSTFGGSVRVWWPGLNRDSDPREHQLWRPEQLAEARNQPFERVLLRRLVTAASFRFGTAGLEARIQAAIARKRQDEIERLWAQAREASLDVHWQEELERAWTQNERLEAQLAEVMEQLATVQENLAAVSAYRHSDDDEPPEANDEGLARPAHGADDEPASVAEAVAWASEQCEHLILLEQAAESASRAAYRQPGRVWKALLAMNEIAGVWEGGRLGMSFFDAFAERGLTFRSHVSSIAVGRFPHEYERTYDGRVCALGPHLALGRGSSEACCRIYWFLDEQRRTFVVGHVGSHLSDTTTG